MENTRGKNLLFGSRSENYERMQQPHAGDVLISDREFNMTIGAVLVWGLFLNFIMVYFFGAYFVEVFANISFIVFLLGYFVLVVLGSFLVCSPSAAISFVGYNLIAVPIGVVLSVSLTGVDSSIIVRAVFATLIVCILMFIMSVVFPSFFLGLGRVLFFSLLAMIIAELACMLIFRTHPGIFDWMAVGLFSLYMGYDWARANQCQRTRDNAVDMATALYLDIINLFIRLVSIFARSR